MWCAGMISAPLWSARGEWRAAATVGEARHRQSEASPPRPLQRREGPRNCLRCRRVCLGALDWTRPFAIVGICVCEIRMDRHAIWNWR
eukprot:6175280-Pleurochrysis_carterae.AAC.1